MKTNKILSFKNIAMAAACLLTFVGSAQTANAQEKADEVVYTTGQTITVGDTVMINRDSLIYLTGERKSTWVYDKKHTVYQVGSKRFPQGILLKEILSWVNPSSLLPISIAAPAIVEEEPAPVVEQVVVEEPAPVVENTDSVKEALKEIEVEETVTYEIPVAVQYDRFTVGVRGSMASTLVNGFPIGFDVLLDLQYAHHWAAKHDAIRLGILTGLSAGYVNVGQKPTAIDDKFTSGDINYHVTGNAKETLHQVLLEVPVMFSMITPKGFFLNAGPKLMLPVYSKANQTLTNGNIAAYLPELNGEAINNEVVTGKLTAEQEVLKATAANQFKLGLGLGLDLGYELKLKNNQSLDFGVYASYGLVSFYKNATDGKIISVVAPNEQSAAVVTVNPISNAAGKIGHLDAGIKIAYNLDFIKK